MPILRKRDYQLPVTCAVLSDEQRKTFFSALRRSAGGRDDRLAKRCGLPASLINEWASGKKNIPYLSLQRLAREFKADMPVVSELRRELQDIVEMKSSAPAGGAGSGRAPSRKPKAKKKREPARKRKERGTSRERPAPAAAKTGGRKKKRGKKTSKKEAPAQGPSAPKLSDETAYWTGVVLCAARWSGGSLTLSADRRMGPNFADTWAQMTRKLIGVRPEIRKGEDGRSQSAALPDAGLEDFLEKAGMRRDAEPAGAPRWAWSNPEWKKAFLKGLMDTTADFDRSPALRMTGLKPELRKAAAKMLSGIGLDAAEDGDADLRISGKDAIARYIEKVGTANLKLRDQIRACLSRPGKEETPKKQEGGRGRRRRRGSRRGRGGKAD